MRYLLLTYLVLCSLSVFNAQTLDVEGDLKIHTLPYDNSSDTLLVKREDGTVGVIDKMSVQEFQVLTRSNDTLYLTNGGFVVLPEDEDPDPSNEIQELQMSNDTIFLSGSNYLVIPGLRNLFLLNQTVQERLDDGSTPCDLLDLGFPIDSLVGRQYEGGVLFYIDTSNCNGLVAATSDQSLEAPWGCSGSSISSMSGYFLDTAMFAGHDNTDTIIKYCLEEGIAAKVCADLDLNGYDDWFLPSLQELHRLYQNLGNQILTLNETYWSSSESTSNTAWAQEIMGPFGVLPLELKSSLYRVRAIRRFGSFP